MIDDFFSARMLRECEHRACEGRECEHRACEGRECEHRECEHRECEREAFGTLTAFSKSR